MAETKNPLSFVSHLFEIAVWPFQVASQHSAKRLPLHDHQSLLLILLWPAILLAIPISLMVSFVVVAYVFVVMPVVAVCRVIGRLFAHSN
jgi:hypothetical protein